MTTALLWIVFVAAGNAALEPLLARRFTSADLSYLVVDAASRAVIAQRWQESERPIPMGSLVKPFTSLAYSQPFPALECDPARCWFEKGHGRVNFREALSVSCNSYFLRIAGSVDPQALASVTARFGLPAPDDNSAETRIGLGKHWRAPAIELARAYAELSARRTEPRIDEIIAGLDRSARSGTASKIGRGALAKTGTAPCVAGRPHAGDGFVVILEPADSPRYVILVRVHGVPGAEAAKTAADILRAVRTGK